MSTEDDAKRRAEENAAPSWKPQVGETLAGEVVAMRHAYSDYGGTFPVVVVRTDADDLFAVYASHTVLKKKLNRWADLASGDKIAITFQGKPPGKDYYSYGVSVEYVDGE